MDVAFAVDVANVSLHGCFGEDEGLLYLTEAVAGYPKDKNLAFVLCHVVLLLEQFDCLVEGAHQYTGLIILEMFGCYVYVEHYHGGIRVGEEEAGGNQDDERDNVERGVVECHGDHDGSNEQGEVDHKTPGGDDLHATRGAAFDWFLEPTKGDYDFIDYSATTYSADRITIQSTHFPAPAAYDASKEFSPSYPEASMAFVPDQGGILELNYQTALAKGVDFHFSTWARQLVRPDNSGHVQGVIARDIDDNYIEFTAKKGVIMAAGDYGSNSNMVKYYCGGRTFDNMWMNKDANGEATNKGEGQQMGMWIGAKMEDGSHAPMTHTLGGALGTDPFFLTNVNGERFMNEDVDGQQLSAQIYRQPDNYATQIFDDSYPDQVEYMPAVRGSVNHIVDETVNPHLDGYTLTIGRTCISSRTEVESDCMASADTLNGLVSQLGLSSDAQATLLASITRYNELCEKGYDEDFGKVATRMFPIKNGPFHATKISAATMLVCLGGLTINPETMNVVGADYNDIKGLYAAGNNMGGRILQDYPVTIGGVSHATALTFGYLAGKDCCYRVGVNLDIANGHPLKLDLAPWPSWGARLSTCCQPV